MKNSTLQDIAHASPFTPFTIHLADGRSVPVPTPDFISIHPEGRTAIVYTTNDGLRILSVAMITEINLEHSPNTP